MRHAALAGPRAATVYAAILLSVALGLLAWRGGDLWTLPGKSPAEIAATRLPAHSTLLVWLDLVFALVVAAVLIVLAGWRLLRCNPWSRGGVDYAGDQTLFKAPR